MSSLKMWRFEESDDSDKGWRRKLTRFSVSSSEDRVSGGATGIGLFGIVRFVLRETRRGMAEFVTV